MAILGSTDLGDGRLFLTVDHDPTSVAKDAPEGSIFFSTATSEHYSKDDDGSTTNVSLFGSAGAQGNQGNQGTAGAAGSDGAQGAQGNQGLQGDAGSAGATGAQGNQGNQGNQGLQGDAGSAGSAGAQGFQGVQGAQGNQGFQGDEGVQGTQGPDLAADNFDASATATTTPGALPTADTLIDSMTVTPGAGTYYVAGSISIARSQANKESALSLWVNDGSTPVQVTGTERLIQGNGGASQAGTVQGIVTLDGATAVEVRWRAVDSGGTISGFGRNIIAIEIA